MSARLGIVFPQAGLAADANATRDFAQAVESLGFDHLLVYDHVLGGDPAFHSEWLRYTYQSLFHEPLALFGFLAAATTRIELVTGVLILPQRDTALVAEQVRTVSSLAPGRVRLGVGVGWNALEYEALGQDFHTRGSRMERQVVELRERLGGETPIWIGGAAEAVLERTARLADGWMPERRHIGPAYAHYVHEPWAAMIARLREHARRNGRDPDALGIEARVEGGDAERLAVDLTEWETLGATHLAINIQPLGAPAVSTSAYIERVARCAALTMQPRIRATPPD